MGRPSSPRAHRFIRPHRASAPSQNCREMPCLTWSSLARLHVRISQVGRSARARRCPRRDKLRLEPSIGHWPSVGHRRRTCSTKRLNVFPPLRQLDAVRHPAVAPTDPTFAPPVVMPSAVEHAPSPALNAPVDTLRIWHATAQMLRPPRSPSFERAFTTALLLSERLSESMMLFAVDAC